MIVTALAAQATDPTSSSPPAESPKERHTGSTTYFDLQGGAGYSTNPDLTIGGGSGAGFGLFAVHAEHTRVSARTTTAISAFAQEILYTNHKLSQQSFSLNARHDARVSERVSVYGDVAAIYDKGGQLGTTLIPAPSAPQLPGITPPILLTPGSDFLSVTGRAYTLSGHLGARMALGEHDNLDVSAGIEHEVFKGGAFDTHYTSIPVSLGYSRQISPQTTIGARVAASRTEYGGPNRFTVITPAATFQTALSPTLTFSGDLGASFASVRDLAGTRHSTGLAANANLCSSTQKSRICAHASVDQATATAAGPARHIGAGVEFARYLDAVQTIHFSLSADRYSNPISVVSGQIFSTSTYARAAADYTRSIGRRLFAGVTASVRKLTQSGPDPKTDLSASIFIRYRFGDVQ